MTKLTKRLVLDLILFAMWVVLMVYPLTGGPLHELLGITMAIGIAVHLIANHRWITAITKRFSGMRWVKAKWNFLLDAVIGVLTLMTAISGILISKDLVPALASANVELWGYLHGWFAYADMALIGVHVGLHGDMIKNALGLNRVKKPIRFIGNLIAAAIAVYGVVASVRYPYPAAYAAATDTSGGDNKPTSSDNKSSIATDSGETPTAGETLAHFLGRLICTGCSRHCPLSAPRCSKGDRQAQQAEEVFYASQGSSDEIVDQDSVTMQNAAAVSNQPSLIDVFAIMGMYSAGTYYVGRFVSKKI